MNEKRVEKKTATFFYRIIPRIHIIIVVVVRPNTSGYELLVKWFEHWILLHLHNGLYGLRIVSKSVYVCMCVCVYSMPQHSCTQNENKQSTSKAMAQHTQAALNRENGIPNEVNWRWVFGNDGGGVDDGIVVLRTRKWE